MDRRAALKKLGAGGAVVAASAVVLPAFPVAATGSGSVPSPLPPPQSSWISPTSGNPNSYAVNLTFPTINCTVSGTADIVGTEWWINSFADTRSGTNTLQVAGGSMVITAVEGTSAPTAVTGPLSGVTFTMSPRRRFNNRTAFSVSVRVTWRCGTTNGSRTYTFSRSLGSGTITVS